MTSGREKRTSTAKPQSRGGTNVTATSESNKASYLSMLPAVLLFSILLPVQIYAGSVVLMPHRIVLLCAFVPLILKLFSSETQKVSAIDLLMIFATLWACLAILVSANISLAIEPMGLFGVEFFGAYLVGRVCVRSAADFRRVVFFCFLALLLLLPFVIAEGVTHTPYLLNIIPNSYSPVYPDPRWGLRRVQAVFAHPILFGVFASTCLGMFAFVLMKGKRVTGVSASLIGSFLSLSTGAFLSVIVQIVLITWNWLFAKSKHRWRIFGALFVLGYFIIDIVSARSPFHVLVRYASFSSNSAYNRILIWNHGTQNVADNPLFGLGLDVGNWVRPSFMSASTDNFWLLLAMSYGLPMLIAFAAAVVLTIQRISKAQLNSNFENLCRAGFLVSMGGIIISGGTVHFYHTMMAFVLFIFGSGGWMTCGSTLQDISTVEDTETGSQRTQYSRFTPRPLRQRSRTTSL